MLGAWLLGERLEPGFLVGVVPLLIGIAVVGGRTRLKRGLARLRRSRSPV